MQNVVVIALAVLIVLFVYYQYDPSFGGMMRRFEGFEDAAVAVDAAKAKIEADKAKLDADKAKADAEKAKAAMAGAAAGPSKQGFMNYEEKKEKPASDDSSKDGFADLGSYEGPAKFGAAEAPAGCYPRDQLTPSELLPKDMNSIWAEQNPMGPGSLKGKNFLSAGALIGVNTVGQSLRNANLQLRSEPPNPQVPVSIFLQSTIAPDISHRPLEIGA